MRTLRTYVESLPTAGILVAVALLIAVGCQGIPVEIPDPEPLDGRTTEDEPNGAFLSATLVMLPADEEASLEGSIEATDDVDVFDLGPASAGDRVRVEAFGLVPGLLPTLAFYDELGNLVNENAPESVGVQAAIDHIVRVNTDPLFVAVAIGAAGGAGGEYEVTLDVQRGGVVPEPQPQIVLLNFAGGTADMDLVGHVSVGEFDAGDIATVYEDQTDVFKAIIKETFLTNYKRFNIVVLNTDDDDRPSGQYTEVLFGGFSAVAFGVSEKVDLYNQDQSDQAVVFTESFTPQLFTTSPSAEMLAVAIGNVASHEAGHCLGLHHVRDPFAIMDEASPAYTLMFDQEFKVAPLSPLVFPLGYQDSPTLLTAILGLDTETARRIGQDSSAWPASSAKAVSREPSIPDGLPYDYQPEGGALGKCLTCMSYGCPGG